jgi:putative ABC transport system ATP-binding protein
LSGGQQQRVAIARALVRRPRIVFADEPTANLDGATAHALLDLIAQLAAQHSLSFLVSTHDSRITQRATHLWSMNDGVLTTEQVPQ